MRPRASPRGTPNVNNKPSGRKIGLVAAAIATIPTIVLVIDLITKSIGLVDAVVDLVVQPNPVVHLSPTRGDNGEHCVEFAFDRLPMDFNLGEVHLEIVDAEGPTPIAGDMVALIAEWTVVEELSPAVFSVESKPIELSMRIQSKKDNDAAYYEYCLVLSRPGIGGRIRVIPVFFSPSGKEIDDLKITIEGDQPVEEGILIDISRPKNVSVIKND